MFKHQPDANVWIIAEQADHKITHSHCWALQLWNTFRNIRVLVDQLINNTLHMLTSKQWEVEPALIWDLGCLKKIYILDCLWAKEGPMCHQVGVTDNMGHRAQEDAWMFYKLGWVSAISSRSLALETILNTAWVLRKKGSPKKAVTSFTAASSTTAKMLLKAAASVPIDDRARKHV